MKLFTFILVAGIALLSSCQKEYDPGVPDAPIVDTTGTVSGDSIYLDKIFYLYDDGSGIDTQSVMQVQYDSRKRVAEIHDSLRNHPGTQPNFDFYFSYNGNDTLPWRTIFIDTEIFTPNSTFTDTVYHFYNAAGKKIRDSILNATSYNGGVSRYLSVISYSYGTNAMYGQKVGDDYNGEINITRDTAVLDDAAIS